MQFLNQYIHFYSFEKNRNSVFLISIFVSLCVHFFVFFLMSQTPGKVLIKPVKQIEVVYQHIKQENKSEPKKKINDLKLIKKQERKKETIKTLPLTNNNILTMPKQEVRDISQKISPFHFEKQQTPQIKMLDVSRKVTIPMIQAEKITNPKYLTYNHNLSQLIQKLASSFIDPDLFQEGHVYLTFILSANGTLDEVRILEEKTQANEHLRDVALRSIRESSPFPPFPEDLNYPELTFNVLISFAGY